MDAAKQKVEALVGQVTAALQTHSQALTESLQKGGLVPGPATADGLVSEGFQPQTQLDVSFGGQKVELGNFFRAGQCKVSPAVSFQQEETVGPEATYTLMMVDPDAPTPDDPKFAFWRHWVVTGLQPLSGDSSIVAATKFPVTAYHPPGPKADSKPHRYLFLLFREPAPLDLKKQDVGGEEFVERRSFKPAELARKLQLTLVGLNWMRCAADDWTADLP